jgi:inorganic pyrophosphatase
MNDDFWGFLDDLVVNCQIVCDRPKGSTHPRYPNETYPVDYGYLKGTSSIDGGGVDIWVGSLGENKIIGVLCTVDLLKKDTELKILYDCTENETTLLMEFVNADLIRAYYLERKR